MKNTSISILSTRRRSPFSLLLTLFILIPTVSYASGHQNEIEPQTWLIIAEIILAAKIGGEIAIRLHQPPVLGELCMGIILGNLTLAGINVFDNVEHLPTVSFLAELGVILLLFEVGLESSIHEMQRIAPVSGLVALIGVIAPMLLGYGVSAWVQPDASFAVHLFVGATLCATSVGITARVLKDLNAIQYPETKVILGAAVIDDILGLLVLAIVASIAEIGHIPDAIQISRIIGLAVLFIVGSLFLGAYVMPNVFRIASKLKAPDVLGALAIGLCLLLSGVAGHAGLAPIVGAFAAGLILDEVHVRPFGKTSTQHISELIAPIVAVMTPLFFVRTGMMVQLDNLGTESLLLALVLTIVAIIGKLIVGIGVRQKGIDRLAVGIGMVPRGEVGLIFANVGSGIMLQNAPLLSSGTYVSIVLMVMATTVITPPWLAQRIRKVHKNSLDGPEHESEAPLSHTDTED